MSAWASVQGGKWHRIPAPVTRENYRDEHRSDCGVSFRVFNSHDDAEPPAGWRNICRKCQPVKVAPAPLPLHRTEAGYPNCSTCDGGSCYDCTDPA